MIRKFLIAIAVLIIFSTMTAADESDETQKLLSKLDDFFLNIPTEFDSQRVKDVKSSLSILFEERGDFHTCAIVHAVAEIGYMDIPILAYCLEEGDADIRIAAAEIINMLEMVPHGAKDALLSATRDEIPSVRVYAAQVLTRFGNEPEIVSALLSMLKMEDVGSRNSAVTAIGILASRDENLTHYVVEALDDEEPSVRVCAITKIEHLRISGDYIDELIRLLSDDNADVRAASIRALGSAGEPAMSALADIRGLIDDENESLRHWAVISTLRIGGADEDLFELLIEAVKSQDYWIGSTASNLAGLFGPAESGYIPELIEMVRGGENDTYQGRKFATRALCKIGRASLMPLLELLKNGSAEKEHNIYYVLRCMGSAAAPVLPDLMVLFEKGEEKQKKAVIQLLSAIGPEPGVIDTLLGIIETADALFVLDAVGALGQMGHEAVPYLTELLSDPDSKLRQRAASTLGSFNLRAVESLPYLLDALDDKEIQVRLAALSSIGYIGSPDDIVIAKLIELLGDRESRIRSSAAYALSRFGPLSADAVGALIITLQDKRSERVRRNSASALGEIGPLASEAVPVLLQALDDEDEEVRDNVIEALPKIEHSYEVVLALMEIAIDATNESRWKAVEALSFLGPDAIDAVPALLGIMRHEDDELNIGVAMALASIDPDGLHGVDELKVIRDGVNAYMRVQAAKILYHLGVEKELAVDTLLETIHDPGEWVRMKSAWAFYDIDPEPRIIKALIEALYDYGEWSTSAAVITLSSYGKDAEVAIPHLIEMLSRLDPYSLDNVIQTLGEFGQLASNALPGLRDIAKYHIDSRVRKLAEEAITRIEGTWEGEE